MRILVLLCLLQANCLFAQNGPWVRFWNKDTTLVGYKDLKGNIKIPPKFSGLSNTDTFYNIMAVVDESTTPHSWHYQLKDGRIVGKDSVFSIDLYFDCESEGKILFYDKKTDRVGFFNKDGKVVIPANYNFASSFYNGVTLAGINGVRSCDSCEHRGWKDYEIVLINDKNEMLVRNWKVDANNFNWYSMRVNDLSVDTSIWVSVKGENGNVYSFVDYEKEFSKWMYNDFIAAVNAGSDKLKKHLFSEITYDASHHGDWVKEPRDVFLKKYAARMKGSIAYARTNSVYIFYDDLNPYIFEGKKYARFHDACWRHLRSRYPMFTFTINHLDGKKQIDYQESFTFIRLEDGYKLLSVQLKETKK